MCVRRWERLDRQRRRHGGRRQQRQQRQRRASSRSEWACALMTWPDRLYATRCFKWSPAAHMLGKQAATCRGSRGSGSGGGSAGGVLRWSTASPASDPPLLLLPRTCWCCNQRCMRLESRSPGHLWGL